MRILLNLYGMYTLVFASRISRYHRKEINGVKIVTPDDKYIVHVSPNFSDDDYKDMCREIMQNGYIDLTLCDTFTKSEEPIQD